MKKKKIFLIAGARPNFMKIAPLYHALIKEDWANSIIVHTGQHYDHNLSHTFFNDLGMPKPDVNLMIGSGSHAEQTAGIMIAFEKLVINEKPDIIIVVGDVNSTLACTITAKKCSIKVAHLEAGLRSFDMSMPEEINRIVTDALSDILWTPSPDADDILLKEGKAKKSIIRVGNIMIDSIRMMLPKIEQDNTFHSLGLQEKSYGVVTLHRPSNVDDKPTLDNICEALVSISEKYPLVFPLHPRTKKQLKQFDIYSKLENTKSIKLLEAMGYISFMSMILHSRFLITDSGGIQEETTYFKIPCFTLRPNTERPITISIGTNKLSTPQKIKNHVLDMDMSYYQSRGIPPLWDGNTASRVVQSLRLYLLSTIEKV